MASAPSDPNPPFVPSFVVGDEASAVLRELNRLYMATAADSRARVVVLDAPAGLGKTLLTRAWFEQLAGEQVAAPYWRATTAGRPASFWPAADPVIFPPRIEPAPGAMADFVWLGLQAAIGPLGRPTNALLDAQPQLEAHVGAITDAISEADQLLIERLRWLLRVIGLVPFAGRLAKAVELALQVKERYDQAREWSELGEDLLRLTHSGSYRIRRARLANEGRTISTDGADAARQQAEDAGHAIALISQVLPVIVAVESAQLLDLASLHFLAALSRSRSRAVVLLTRRPEAAPRAEPAADFERRWLRAMNRAGRLTRLRLDPLPHDSLRQLANEILTRPGPNEAALDLVIDAAHGNPARLKALLALDWIWTADHADLASRSELDRGLRTAGPDLTESFAALDDSIRHTLAVASLLGPATRWDWLTEALGSIGAGAASSDGRIESALRSGWLYLDEDSVLRFSEFGSWSTARTQAELSTAPTARAAVAARLRAIVLDRQRDDAWAEVPDVVAEAALTAVLAEPGPALDEELRLAFADLIDRYRVSGRADQALPLLTALQRREARAITGALADEAICVHLGRGDYAAARVLAAREVERLREIYGPDDPAVLTAQHGQATVEIAARDFAAARGILQLVLAERVTRLPSGHPAIRSARLDLAKSYAAHGQHRSAAELYQAQYDEDVATSGVAGEVTILDALTLNYAWAFAGEPERAADGFAALVPIAVARYGRASTYALAARQGRAGSLGQAGRTQTAIELTREIIDELTLRLGADHPQTLMPRHNLGYLLGLAGHPDLARDEYEQLVAIRNDVLGPVHRDTLLSRYQHALFVGESGDNAEAERLFRELVDDSTQALGPTDPDTMRSRHSLAVCTVASGDLVAARDLLRDIVADRVAVLSPTHPDTIESRERFASVLDTLREAVPARDAYQDLVRDERVRLGSTHPRTMTLRHALANNTGRAGDPASARQLFDELVHDRTEELGADHLDTFAARMQLASYTGQCGDVTGARDRYADLVADYARAIGARRPETLTARNQLAYYRQKCGDEAGAAAELEQIQRDQR
jgi:hypothetical protein